MAIKSVFSKITNTLKHPIDTCFIDEKTFEFNTERDILYFIAHRHNDVCNPNPGVCPRLFLLHLCE